jgi:hypothetical protein
VENVEPFVADTSRGEDYERLRGEVEACEDEKKKSKEESVTGVHSSDDDGSPLVAPARCRKGSK